MGRRPINGPALTFHWNPQEVDDSRRPLKPASHGLTPSASLARRPLERVIVAALVLLSACRLRPSRSRLQLLVALPHRPRIGVLGISPASCWRVAQEL